MARYESKGTWFETHGENAPKLSHALSVAILDHAYAAPDTTLLADLRRLFHAKNGNYVANPMAEVQDYHRAVGSLLRKHEERERQRAWFIYHIRAAVRRYEDNGGVQTVYTLLREVRDVLARFPDA